MKILTLCQTDFKPFKASMDSLSAYATVAHDVFDSHCRHTTNLQTAGVELGESVTAAVAIVGPDTSPIAYGCGGKDETETLKSHVTALL